MAISILAPARGATSIFTKKFSFLLAKIVYYIYSLQQTFLFKNIYVCYFKNLTIFQVRIA